MKKIICTIIAMVTLMTPAGATNVNSRNFSDYIREGVAAQMSLRETKYYDIWGQKTMIQFDAFGFKNFYWSDSYDLAW